MLTFVALPKRDSMAIYNAQLTFDVSGALPATDQEIEIIGWTGKEGFFEYTEGLRITREFVNLAPYAPLIRAWLTAAGESLTLDLAKQVMRDFIIALYYGKRQAPYPNYPYAGYRMQASDNALMYYGPKLTLGAGGTGGLVLAINNRLTHINNYFIRAGGLQLNQQTTHQDYSGDVGSGGGAGSANTFITRVRWAGGGGTMLVSASHLYVYTDALHGLLVTEGQPYLFSWPVAMIQSTDVGGGANVAWEDVGANAMRTLTYDQATALMGLILTREQTLLTQSMAHINNVLSMTVLTDVINYDPTPGWGGW